MATETNRQNLLENHKKDAKDRAERNRYETKFRRLNRKAMEVLQALIDNEGLGWEPANYISNPAGRFVNKAMGLEFRPLNKEMHHILEVEEGRTKMKIDLETMLENRKMDIGQKAMAVHETMLFICEVQLMKGIRDRLCGRGKEQDDGGTERT